MARGRSLKVAVALGLATAIACQGAGASGAAASQGSRYAQSSRAATKSPTAPPLLSSSPGAAAEANEASGAASPAGEVDPLVSNGLGSPSCRAGYAGELSTALRRNCETSGFIGAAAPTGDFGIDVHIDTGVFGLSSGGLLSTVQDLIVTPVWMALVWIVHALAVMLEWCFTLNLADGGNGVAGALATAQRYLTSPWLPLVLSIAAVLLAYEGLVRRRVAESLGQALLVLAMIGGGLWVMLNPAGTIGVLSGWTNEAGLGTLAVSARGTPGAPGQALGSSIGGLFAATIEGPWCYLEFGDVRWCRDPAMLDGRLRQAGLGIAKEELAQSSCHSAADCSGPVERSARLLREARTNGELFLALPSNGPARNSINSHTSLLHALCQSEEATSCAGPTAAEAEFRTNSGTWARVGGLLLISFGVLGMVLLLGHIGLRLLMAAMMSVFYLLLAPAVVLAPALGERGRAAFRAWAARLFGAVVSKLVYAFVLGVVLAVMDVIGSLNAIGWWTQWLLLAAFWWGVFFRRNHLIGGASSLISGVQQRERTSIGRRAAQMVEGPLRHRISERINRKRSGDGPPVKSSGASGARNVPSSPRAGQKALGSPAIERPRERLGEGASDLAEAHKRAQLQRVISAHTEASSAGDTRRAAQLTVRRERIEDELRPASSSGGGGGSATGPSGQQATAGEHSRFLDLQASLPARGTADGAGRRRDYAAIAPLAGLARAQYEQLGPGAQRAARLEIDRELAARREAGPGAPRTPSQSRTAPPAVPAAPRSGPGGAGSQREATDVPRPERRPRPRQEHESEVWHDIREVEAGRKRQLGIGRP